MLEDFLAAVTPAPFLSPDLAVPRFPIQIFSWIAGWIGCSKAIWAIGGLLKIGRNCCIKSCKDRTGDWRWSSPLADFSTPSTSSSLWAPQHNLNEIELYKCKIINIACHHMHLSYVALTCLPIVPSTSSPSGCSLAPCTEKLPIARRIITNTISRLWPTNLLIIAHPELVSSSNTTLLLTRSKSPILTSAIHYTCLLNDLGQGETIYCYKFPTEQELACTTSCSMIKSAENQKKTSSLGISIQSKESWSLVISLTESKVAVIAPDVLPSITNPWKKHTDWTAILDDSCHLMKISTSSHTIK